MLPVLVLVSLLALTGAPHLSLDVFSGECSAGFVLNIVQCVFCIANRQPDCWNLPPLPGQEE